MKKQLNRVIQCSVVIAVIVLLGGITTTIHASVKNNTKDVEALNKIIKAQKRRGAEISTNIYYKKQYKWDKKTGRLTELIWNRRKIKGKLDLSGLKALKKVYLNGNNITKIRFGRLKNLDDVSINNNKLKTINVSKLKKLKHFGCSKNSLRKLNLNHNINLKTLGCDHNKLKRLNLKNTKKLVLLNCEYNQLETLDTSNCDMYRGISCQHNRLKTIKLRHKSQLGFFYCHNNQLTELNLDGILCIEEIMCFNNQIECLNFTRMDQYFFYSLICDKNVKIIGRDERIKIESMQTKKNRIIYEFDSPELEPLPEK